MRILVVEDHAETRGIIEAVLSEGGYAPVPAATLGEARTLLEAGGLAAVVLDWMLPDGSGPELCVERRAAGDATPILVLTARAGVEDRVVGLDAGGRETPLTAREFDILEVLARHRGQVVTRSDLLIALWGDDKSGSESLDVLLARLRRKLAAAGALDAIRTHRGVGFSIGVSA